MPATEAEVGVTRFVAEDRPGFRGTIKARFRDFLVNEITRDGVVCHLTDQSVPAALASGTASAPAIAAQAPPSASATAAAGAAPDPAAARASGLATLEQAAGKEVRNLVAKLLDEIDAAAAKAAAGDAAASQAPTADAKADDSAGPTDGQASEPAPATAGDDGSQPSGADAGDGPAKVAAAVAESAPSVDQSTGAQEAEAESYSRHVVLPPISDKGTRQKVHQLVREHFGSFLLTDTVLAEKGEGDAEWKITTRDSATAQRLVRVVHNPSGGRGAGGDGRNGKRGRDSGGRGGRRGRGGKRAKLEHAVDQRSLQQHEEWPADRGNYCKFLLYKENLDMQETLHLLRRHLQASQDSLEVAGTKDKRGVTVQQVSAYRITAERLLEAAEAIRSKKGRPAKMHVGNFEYVAEGLRLGDHGGNRFTVVFRDVELRPEDGQEPVRPGDHSDEARAAKEAISSKVAAWEAGGFLNYFGMQRFGTTDIGTHEIGVAILRGEDQRAVDLLVQARDSDHDAVKEAVELFRSTGQTSALHCLPNDLVALRAIMRRLSRYSPELGLAKGEPVKLDGYEASHYASAIAAIPFNLRTLYVNAFQSLLFNELVSERVARYGAGKVVVGDLVVPQEARTGASAKALVDLVQVVTAEDLDKWSIEDVVLPLLGSQLTKFPEHEVGREFCDRLLGKHGLSVEALRVANGKLVPPGSYRVMVIKPRAVEHEWVFYGAEHANAELALTDVDRLEGVSLDSLGPPERAALRLSFTLANSSYATMGFRELMKAPTHRAALRRGG